MGEVSRARQALLASGSVAAVLSMELGLDACGGVLKMPAGAGGSGVGVGTTWSDPGGTVVTSVI